MQPLKSVWVFSVLLGLVVVRTEGKDVPVPQQVSLSANLNTQQVSISWDGGAATVFDLLIVRTELNDTVFYETLSVERKEGSGRHEFNWTSAEPLECTSLSVKIRSRSGQETSEWSSTQILQGNDRPSEENTQVYPQDKVITAGSTITFCCIIGEGKTFASFHFISSAMNVTRLSRRTFAATVSNPKPSPAYGYNAYCLGSTQSEITGSVLFVGYPPLLNDFICETHDLTSAVCQWTEAQSTHLYGRRQTRYSINGRNCSVIRLEHNRKQCNVPHWEDKWTLMARNPLGAYNLTDVADVRSRIVPLPPEELSAEAKARTATVTWQWKHSYYSSLPLVCQVELTSSDNKTKRTFSGVALRSVVLVDLFPFEEYSIKVRCGAQQNFWKWGNWSKTISFQTVSEAPGVSPDVWIWMNSDQTGQVIWKPYKPRQSHGPIVSYEVTLWSPDDNSRHTQIFSPDTFTMSVNLSEVTNKTKVIASVVAKNPAGLSPPASVVLPLHVTDPNSEAVTRVDFKEGAFPLSWQSDANSSCGYIVEWNEALCQHDCPVEWIKVGYGINNVSIKSDSFEPGVRYYFSLYSCSSEAPELLQRWQGYMRELSPSSSVQLLTSQQESDVLLTWSEIPPGHQRGFILGYNVYMNNGSQLLHIAKLSNQQNSYTVKDLPFGSYKFTVKAYTSAGEDTGGPASIALEPYADWLIMEILVTLGVTSLALIIVTFICYKKRKWVKGAFYPDIPEPKLPGDWSRPQAQGTLDIKPSPHSTVHIVEKPEWDSSKEALVVIPEEDEDDDGQGIRDESVDTDEPTSLRYYNQVVDDRPIRPRYPDSSASSASSLDSARTDVTYTGIQTSGSSLVFHSDPQSSSESHEPGVGPVSCGGADGGYRPQLHTQPQHHSLAPPQSLPESQVCSSSGYRPQNNWHLDSPGEADERRSLAPSLGSPTSIASTQFLLPDGFSDEPDEKHQTSSAATWLSNLLSSTKP